MLHMLEVCEVSSSFLKLMIMITHIKMMQIPYFTYGQGFSQQVLHTSCLKLFKSLLWNVQRLVIVQTLSLRKIIYRTLRIAFFHKLISM